MRTRCLLLTLLCLLLTGWLQAATTRLWQAEAEAAVPPDDMRFGAAIVDDADASGDKAIRMPWKKDARGCSVQFVAPGPVTLHEKALMTLQLRGEKMLPITDPVWVYLIRPVFVWTL